MDSPLRIEREGELAVLTLDRPAKRNALSIELRELLAEALDSVEPDSSGAVVLAGSGSAFCSGMDVTQFGGDAANRRRLVDSSLGCFAALERVPVPVIAAVGGPALAGGFVLALAADVRIAGPGARFGFSELPRGIPPSFAAARATLPAAVARELSTTGRIIGPEEALRLGVTSELTEDPVARAVELGREICGRPRAAVVETRRRIRHERELLFGPLFREEEERFRAALLGGD